MSRGDERTSSKSGKDKPLLRTLGGEVLARTPFWLMRQAGRYLAEYREVRARAKSFLELCYTPALAAEVTMQPIRRFGMDAAILFSDILVVPHALGQEVAFREGEGPVLRPVRTVADVEALAPDRAAARWAPVFETVERVASLLPDETALIGFAGAPWTVATYMVEGGGSRDFCAVKSWAIRDPEGFSQLMDHVAEATIEYLSGQVAAGADVLQLFDSWAGVLPEEMFERWVIAPTRRIVKALEMRCPGVPVIGFPRGAGFQYERYFSETGVTAVGVDQMMPPAIAARTLQPLGPVQGNLDPIALLVGGTKMRQAIETILKELAQGAFIFNLGHGVLPETPVDNVAALAAILRGTG